MVPSVSEDTKRRLDSIWSPVGLHGLFDRKGEHTCHVYVFECVGDVLVDLVRFELTTSSMPWSRHQSLTREYSRAIWTSFGPHALFHACLDLKRSNPWRSVVAVMPFMVVEVHTPGPQRATRTRAVALALPIPRPGRRKGSLI